MQVQVSREQSRAVSSGAQTDGWRKGKERGSGNRRTADAWAQVGWSSMCPTSFLLSAGW
jgi:uncharacterized protein YbdZ (MbtH family)